MHPGMHSAPCAALRPGMHSAPCAALPLQETAKACGQLAVLHSRANYTLSIAADALLTLECQQQAGAAAAGGSAPPSCARCPQLIPATNYTLLLVAQSPSGATSQAVSVPVFTLGTWSAAAPALLGTPGVAAAPGTAGETALALAFAVDRPGRLHYLVVYDSMYARFMDTYVVFDNQVCTSACSRMCHFRAARV
jgi:hypothetical protein